MHEDCKRKWVEGEADEEGVDLKMPEVYYTDRNCDGCGRYRGYLIVSYVGCARWLCLNCYRKEMYER